MCGLHGTFGNHLARAADMTRACQHRGPDGSGLFNDNHMALGHNLLAVRGSVDQSKQPYEFQGKVLTYNGEVYDFGSSWRTASGVDTHELANRLDRYGAKTLGSTDGMYALAWYDPVAEKVLLARDRLGAKPLYYAEENGRATAFSSELRGLFAAGVRRCLDPVGVRLYLQFGYVPGPRTLIAGVRKLAPGECREYDAAGRLGRSWNTCRPVEPTEFDPVVYREKLVESVRRTLPTVRETGLFLSGGLDSASVLWAMRELGVTPNTLSMRFADAGTKQVLLDGDCDAAWVLAESLGTRHSEVRFTQEHYLAWLDEAFSCDEPIARKGMPAYLAANDEAARLGWTVAFTGDGGDELLSGYGRQVRLLWPEYEESRMAADPVAVWVHMQSHGGAEKAWRSDEARALDVAAYMRSWLPPVLSQDKLRNELQLECLTHLAEDFLIRSDKLGMSRGLETRFPLLAEPFRSYALGLPSHLKVEGRTIKALARRAMRGVLPDLIVDKPKSGWGPPTGNWLKGKDDLVGPLGDRIRAALVPGRCPAVDRVLDVSRIGRIKVKLALFYLVVWAEQVGLE